MLDKLGLYLASIAAIADVNGVSKVAHKTLVFKAESEDEARRTALSTAFCMYPATKGFRGTTWSVTKLTDREVFDSL